MVAGIIILAVFWTLFAVSEKEVEVAVVMFILGTICLMIVLL